MSKIKFERVFNSVAVCVDINPRFIFSRNPDVIKKAYLQAANEVLDFIKDHRSIDDHNVYLDVQYYYKCPFCGWIYESKPVHGDGSNCCYEILEALQNEWIDD